MSPARYLARSLVHHRHATLGVFAGAVLGATVLLGALFAGASVRASLARAAEQRTGQATQILTAGDRFFRAELAGELATAAGGRGAPVLLTQGSAVNAGSQARARHVQRHGALAAFAGGVPRPAPPPGAGAAAVAVSLTLATRLGLKVGDTLVVRFPKPGVIAGNAPIAGAETSLESLRCRVAAVIGDDAYGRFGLEASQLPPATAYLPLARLQEALEVGVAGGVAAEEDRQHAPGEDARGSRLDVGLDAQLDRPHRPGACEARRELLGEQPGARRGRQFRHLAAFG